MKSKTIEFEQDKIFSDIYLPIIMTEVSNFFAIEDIVEKNRNRDLVKSRQYYYSLCKRFTDASLTKIGMSAGGRDHATVMHGLKAFKNMYDTEFEYRHDYNRLEYTVKKRLKSASFTQDDRLREERIEYLKQRKKDIKRELKFLLEG